MQSGTMVTVWSRPAISMSAHLHRSRSHGCSRKVRDSGPPFWNSSDGNLGAAKLKLTEADVQENETSLSKFPVYGDRMGKSHMSSIDYTT